MSSALSDLIAVLVSSSGVTFGTRSFAPAAGVETLDCLVLLTVYACASALVDRWTPVADKDSDAAAELAAADEAIAEPKAPEVVAASGAAVASFGDASGLTAISGFSSPSAGELQEAGCGLVLVAVALAETSG